MDRSRVLHMYSGILSKQYLIQPKGRGKKISGFSRQQKKNLSRDSKH